MGLGGVLALDQIIKTVINLSIILNHIHIYQNCFLSSCLNTRVGTDKRKLNLHTQSHTDTHPATHTQSHHHHYNSVRTRGSRLQPSKQALTSDT